MAQGDITVFDTALIILNDKGSGTVWDIADTFNFALVDNTDAAALASRDTAAPHWGGTGTTDFSTNEVGTGATAYTGPVALANPAWTEAAANTFRLDFDNITQIAQDGSGPTDIYWMVIYNNTDTYKRVLCSYDMGGPISLVGGTLDFSFNANGVYQIT